MRSSTGPSSSAPAPSRGRRLWGKSSAERGCAPGSRQAWAPSRPSSPAVGISGLVKVRERVLNGQPLCVVHANDQGRLAEAHAILDRTIVVGPGAVPRAALVGEIIG